MLGVLVLQRVNQPADTPVERAADPAPSPAPRSASGEIAIAVLPLDNFSGDPAQDYFADGMTEALTADLARISGLHVISRTSTMLYKNNRKPLRQIAQELGVDLVVEGSVMRAENRVRITAQLIDAKTDRHLWARAYDRTLKDVLALQAEVATAIATEVKGAIPATQVAALNQRRAVDPVAYDLYLRGRHEWGLRTPAGYENAIRYYTEATERDPDFAQAYAGLADVYVLQGAPLITGVPLQNMKLAQQAAVRAIELDDRLAESHTSLGAVLFFGSRDFAGAEREFRRAIELNRQYPTAHQWLAILLSEQGRDREAVEHATAAVTIDPLSGTMRQTIALVHYYGRRYDEAIAAGRRALELNAQLPLARNIMAKAFMLKGEPKSAAALLEPASARTAEGVMLLGVAYARAGARAAADALYKELSARGPDGQGALIQWHAATGNLDAAFALLNQVGEPPAPVLRVDPFFDQFRDDRRFADLARRAQTR